MIKFDHKYVIAVPCEAADELIGKEQTVFAADSLFDLRRAVEDNKYDYKVRVRSQEVDSDYPFDCIFLQNDVDNQFRYIYYDPYYDLRVAAEQGHQIEIWSEIEQRWNVLIEPSFDADPDQYRVAGETHKLEIFPLGTSVRVRADVIWGIVTAYREDDGKYFVGGYWYKTEELEACGE